MSLQTERLLRLFAEGDGPAFHEYVSDPEVARYTNLLPISQAQEMIDNIVGTQAASDGPLLAFAITLRADGS